MVICYVNHRNWFQQLFILYFVIWFGEYQTVPQNNKLLAKKRELSLVVLPINNRPSVDKMEIISKRILQFDFLHWFKNYVNQYCLVNVSIMVICGQSPKLIPPTFHVIYHYLVSYVSNSTYLSQEISHSPACCTSYRQKEKTMEIGKETCSIIHGWRDI